MIALAEKLSKIFNEFEKIIKEAGGILSKTVSYKVSFLIASEVEYAKDSNKIGEAKIKGIPIMKEDFIHESIRQNKKLDTEERKLFYLYDPLKKRNISQINSTNEEENTKKKSRQSNRRGEVDEIVKNRDELQVYDEEGDKYGVWSVKLTKVAIENNLNSYYILQLLESIDKTREEYYVLRKWGRIGVKFIENHKITKYVCNLVSAKYEFMKVFKEITGVDWENRRNFQKEPGKR